ncbi:lysylphosphatidylglycerol synthase domain-containing protein [Myceligenerans salitolerans]|uniref:Flippase-like domain-containing protein n=1 Tax=Myceligenerans salitolerans TaxID=1230528 RepID=A0ABS3IBU0_9MICO|nr:lysylphosphatidylglycerol synthase domain-containing protein [Myceligenerans salitolerans]MBO0610481.1 flippase-like domain-containing protein [Myceligenerans salitolerans]
MNASRRTLGRAIAALGRLAGRPPVRRTLWLVAGGVVAASVLLALRSSLDEGGLTVLRMFDSAAIAWPLAGGLAANVVGVYLSMRAWRVFVDGPSIDPRSTTRIFYVGFLSKFVPGRVWGILAQIEVGRAAGLDARRIVSAFFLSMATGLLAGALLGVATVPLAFETSFLATALVVAGTVGAVVVVAWPRSLTRAVRRAVTAAGRAEVVEATPAEVRTSLLLATGGWVLSGAHVGLLSLAAGAGTGAAVVAGIGGFAAATVAGTLAVVFPDGIGVREVALTAVLAAILPLDGAIAIVLMSRLLCLVGEVLLCGSWLLVDLVRRRRDAPDAPRSLARAGAGER